jgi:hypothetical protein
MRTQTNLINYFNRFNVLAEITLLHGGELGIKLKNKDQYLLARSIAENLGFAVLLPYQYNYNRNTILGADFAVY